MPLLLSEIPLDPADLHRLQTLPGLTVHLLAPHERRWDVKHERRWDLPEEWLHVPDILLCKFPPDNIAKMTNLKMMQITMVGFEHLSGLDLGSKPFQVCNARGIFDTAIAEWNLAMMVNLTRDLRGMIRNQEQSRWSREARFQQEARGSVLGLWGYGGIGRETARLAKAFGMRVHVMTRSGIKPRHDTFVEPGTGDQAGELPDRVFVPSEEAAFLAGLNFLVLAMPHTRQTDGLIGPAQFRALPRTAFVLNPARGPLIQEKALLEALEQNLIAGAAIDTHFAYPLPPDHPLWRFPNVILTPHVAGGQQNRQFNSRMADLVIQNVSRFLDGKPLLNRISPEEWREI